MNVSFRVLSEVDEKGVGVCHGGVEIIVERRVAHEQSQRTLVIVERRCESLEVGKCL